MTNEEHLLDIYRRKIAARKEFFTLMEGKEAHEAILRQETIEEEERLRRMEIMLKLAGAGKPIPPGFADLSERWPPNDN